MMARADDRIRKLLALAHDSAAAPAEAALAAQRAQEAIDRQRADASGVVQRAFDVYLHVHGFAPLPVRWVRDLAEGYGAVWYAERCALDVAAKTALPMPALGDVYDRMIIDAGWNEVRALHPGVVSYGLAMLWCASAMATGGLKDNTTLRAAFVDAHNAGLWVYWLRSTEILAVPAPAVHVENGLLHCGSGPAVKWDGGQGLYFWRGTHVPAAWVEHRELLDPATALTWPNIEQRSAAADIIGWARIIDRLPCRIIDAHANPMVGTLLSVTLPDDHLGTRFLKVQCATGRTFVLCVPRECRTAAEAQVAMWPGLTEDEVLTTLQNGRRA